MTCDYDPTAALACSDVRPPVGRCDPAGSLQVVADYERLSAVQPSARARAWVTGELPHVGAAVVELGLSPGDLLGFGDAAQLVRLMDRLGQWRSIEVAAEQASQPIGQDAPVCGGQHHKNGNQRRHEQDVNQAPLPPAGRAWACCAVS